ncbi:TetR/AcrR family transcriptional regulator [Arthrobacter russicus]|uniref:AcrR family transcriptional regulator n=1 Tax=Arthrobacter russicus TaxID=172040 RepID=A0ABU1JFR7_9MICC|nr:TetR/AcrR family transcriptional regulator [Arthrobacter russicus]MDR6270691.1 AcrR family transcriptional regulator [Arthrobacter russicus]
MEPLDDEPARGALASHDAEPTQRSQAKASRREALLAAAAELFAQRGFNGVSIEELGAAAGVSGPAVYRHFSGKQSVLAALLLDVSEELLAGGRAVVRDGGTAAATIRRLVAFHVEFALGNADIIRVQDRDLASMNEVDRNSVRTLQRDYVQLWVDVLGRLHPDAETVELRVQAHAAFGLINSTPHSLRSHSRSGRATPAKIARPVLERMALAALLP